MSDKNEKSNNTVLNRGYCLYSKQEVAAGSHNEACPCFDCPRDECDACCATSLIMGMNGLMRVLACNQCLGKQH